MILKGIRYRPAYRINLLTLKAPRSTGGHDTNKLVYLLEVINPNILLFKFLGALWCAGHRCTKFQNLTL